MMKRLTAVIIIFMMLAPCTLPAYAEKNETCEELVTALGLISDYEDGTFRPETFVTNKEMIAAVYKMSGIKDTEETYSAQPLKDAGLLKSFADGDEAVLAEDFVFAMVRLLGYKDENYQKSASDAGLFKGVNLKSGYVTRAAFSKMIYNTLLADRMVLSEISGDKITFEKKGTLLEDIFNVRRVDGVVGADWSAYISEEPAAGLVKGEMIINGITVSGVINTKDYLGRRVEAFLKFEDKSELNAEVLVIKAYKNDEMKATSEFIDGATTSSQLVWLDPDSNKLKKRKIPKDAVLIYNGKRMGTAQGQEWSLFTPADGEVNLIDNDGDSEAEAVIVWNYTPYVVDYVNAENNTIFNKIGNNPLDLTDREYSLFNSDGSPAELGSLEPLEVISVARGTEETDEIIIRRADKKPVSGTYTKDGYGILIGSDEYSLSNWCDLSGINNGDKVTVYLDMYDRPVYIAKQSVYEYGYMSGVSYGNETDEVMYVKLYTFDRGVKKYELDDKVSVQFQDGKEKFYRNKSGDVSFAELYKRIGQRRELIKFRTGPGDKIKEIVFPKYKTSQKMPNTKDGFDVYYGDDSADSLSFRTAKFLQNMFVSRYRVTGSTKVVSVEENPSEPEKFKRISVSDLVSDSDYDIIVYDVNEKFEAGAIVIKKADTLDNWYSKFGSLVESVSYAADEDGNELLQFSVYTLGEQKTLFADNPKMLTDSEIAGKFKNEKVTLSQVSAGDVIYYQTGSDGKISAFAMLHKNDGGEFYHRSNYGWGGNYIPNAAMAVTYCRVEKTYQDLIIADIDGLKPIGEYTWRNYYIYEKSRNKVRKAAFTDVKPGDKIVGLWKWSNLNDLIIYR